MASESKSKIIPFYVCLLIGQEEQCEVYSKLLMKVTDESLMKQYHQINYNYFTENMCKLLFHCLPTLAIYGVGSGYGGAMAGMEEF